MDERIIKEAARKLREEQTPAEKLLWEYLRNKEFGGFKFRRQEAVERFVADFICKKKKLIIELDGKVHLNQKERDKERDLFLSEQGYKVIRFSNEQIEQNIDDVLNKINDRLLL